MSAPVPARARPYGPVLKAAELLQWQEGAAMLADAAEQAAALRASSAAAHDAECRRGYEEGREQAAAELAQRLLVIDDAASSAARAFEAALPGLVCDIVEGILGERPAMEQLRLAVRRALGRIRHDGTGSLRAAPDCQDALREALSAMPHGSAGLRVEVDPGLAPGRCVFESELGVVELGIAAQLRVLRETMLARWEQAA